MKRFLNLAALVAFTSSFVACTAPPEVGSASQAIINGVTDTGDPAVVMVLSQVPGSMQASLCTGEVISPHVVLTAAHCVDPASVGAGAKTIVFIGQQLPQSSAPAPSDLLAVKEVHFDSAFNINAAQNGHDVGVAILTNPTTITPIPYNRSPIPTSMQGGPVRLVGYGITDASDTMGTTAGTRRQAPTTLAHVDDLFVGLQDGSHGICEGDSGGPAFMTFGGTERIIGVTSFGFQGCPLTAPSGTPAGFEAGNDTRVDSYASFIDQWVTMFDPPAKGPGDMCTSDADCLPLSCQQTSVGKICVQSCDPAAMPSTCPTGTTCTNVDGANLCVAAGSSGGGSGGGGGGGKSGGCAVAGRAPVGGFGLFVGALALVALRRRRARAYPQTLR
ncbi:MAG: S1 family peptidase [Polyangia bacterium]